MNKCNDELSECPINSQSQLQSQQSASALTGLTWQCHLRFDSPVDFQDGCIASDLLPKLLSNVNSCGGKTRMCRMPSPDGDRLALLEQTLMSSSSASAVSSLSSANLDIESAIAAAPCNSPIEDLLVVAGEAQLLLHASQECRIDVPLGRRLGILASSISERQKQCRAQVKQKASQAHASIPSSRPPTDPSRGFAIVDVPLRATEAAKRLGLKPPQNLDDAWNILFKQRLALIRANPGIDLTAYPVGEEPLELFRNSVPPSSDPLDPLNQVASSSPDPNSNSSSNVADAVIMMPGKFIQSELLLKRQQLNEVAQRLAVSNARIAQLRTSLATNAGAVGSGGPVDYELQRAMEKRANDQQLYDSVARQIGEMEEQLMLGSPQQQAAYQ